MEWMWKASNVEDLVEDLVELLGQHCTIPVTYAGGVRSIEDMDRIRKAGSNKVDATVGSALDCFGGELAYVDRGITLRVDFRR